MKKGLTGQVGGLCVLGPNRRERAAGTGTSGLSSRAWGFGTGPPGPAPKAAGRDGRPRVGVNLSLTGSAYSPTSCHGGNPCCRRNPCAAPSPPFARLAERDEEGVDEGGVRSVRRVHEPPGPSRRNRAARTGPPGPGHRNRVADTGSPGVGCRDRGAGSGLAAGPPRGIARGREPGDRLIAWARRDRAPWRRRRSPWQASRSLSSNRHVTATYLSLVLRRVASVRRPPVARTACGPFPNARMGETACCARRLWP
jgi:hypothetical protein